MPVLLELVKVGDFDVPGLIRDCYQPECVFVTRLIGKDTSNNFSSLSPHLAELVKGCVQAIFGTTIVIVLLLKQSLKITVLQSTHGRHLK